ncbi:hypothetical protein IAR55_002233 [Kwoniella newhampshirensis]|uniref:N-acetyltransferase ESCO acetyl-transferase domain-containing protein n=1 Tax=Kwoniella newhampshirensis TaxID=1651941 RepID=A0AAW0YS73_9TREE
MSKPTVHRTYGRLPVRSSSSLFDTSSPPPPDLAFHVGRSSTPPSSSRLESPPPCSPSPVRGPVLKSRSSSPLFLPHDDDDEDEVIGQENVKPPSSAETVSFNKKARISLIGKPKFAKTAVQSTLKGFFTPIPQKRKRPLQPATTVSAPRSTQHTSSSSTQAGPSSSSRAVSATSTTKHNPLTQLHLTHLPLLHTCPDCSMSYMRGGEDDSIHIAHHSKVLRGIPWEGLGKAKGKGKSSAGETGWKVIEEGVEFGPRSSPGHRRAKGRIVMLDGSFGGAKLDEILCTVDLVLSSPPLPPAILDQCKIFVFLTSSPAPPPSSSTAKRPRLDVSSLKVSSSSSVGKERIVSVVVAQGIKFAMRVLSDGESVAGGVESGGFGSVTCDPQPLPTPLGIHRLYTSPLYRSHGLSYHLLNAASQNTIYGCTFSPIKGEVAFSQPTESGRSVMEKWGKGEVRVFIDDERQL